VRRFPAEPPRHPADAEPLPQDGRVKGARLDIPEMNRPRPLKSIGCKWSLTVIDLVRRGVHRPGAMEHAIDGLSAKVLNERLVKLVRFGILEKTSFAEVPPRVEYHLTAFGLEFSALLDQVDQLEQRIAARQ